MAEIAETAKTAVEVDKTEQVGLLSKAKEFISTIPYNRIGLRDIVGYEKEPRNNLLAVIIIAFIAMFVVGVAIYLMHGHHAYNVTREHPWGLLMAAHSNLGAVFGFLNARPISNGVFYPTYFILTAFITGIFLAYIMMGWRYKLAFPENAKIMLTGLAKIEALLLSILIFFVTWKMLTDIYGGMPNRAEVAVHIFYSWTFWAEVILAMLIPLYIIIKDKGHNIQAMFWASLGGMVGIFFMRYNLVHDTQLKPLQMMKIREYQLTPEWIHYFPSGTEIMISLGGLGLCLLMYYVGNKVFNLDADETH